MACLEHPCVGFDRAGLCPCRKKHFSLVTFFCCFGQTKVTRTLQGADALLLMLLYRLTAGDAATGEGAVATCVAPTLTGHRRHRREIGTSRSRLAPLLPRRATVGIGARSRHRGRENQRQPTVGSRIESARAGSNRTESKSIRPPQPHTPRPYSAPNVCRKNGTVIRRCAASEARSSLSSRAVRPPRSRDRKSTRL